MCCMRLAEIQDTKNYAKKSPSVHHRNLGTYRQSKKNLLNSNIFSTCPHNMMNFCLVTAEIDWWILGTPANFNGFRVLASLLHRCHSTEVNQTLHDVWPFPGLVHYIYIFGVLSPNGLLPGAKFTLRPSLPFSYICSVTAWHWNNMRQPNFAAYNTRNGITALSLLVTFYRGRRLYSEGGHNVGQPPTL